MGIIEGLQNKNNSEAFKLLTELEKLSESSDELYPYFDEFIRLTKSGSAFVRTRGFRLACAMARWDGENRLERDIDILLEMLRNEKGTQVRQCIEALRGVVIFKPSLGGKIVRSLESLDLSAYKDSMRELILKDIEKLRCALNDGGNF